MGPPLTVKATLTFIIDDGKVLLIRKKTGFGAGKINGIGGKIEEEEKPEEAAIREVEEEVGVKVCEITSAGILYFYSTNSEPDWVVYVYRAKGFSGTPRETLEATPIWVSLDSLPFREMWEDDRHWLPHVLAGNKVEGYFFFNSDYSKMERYVLNVY